MKELSKDWDKPQDNVIDVPDELMPLFNQIGVQLRLHTMSQKNEVLTITRMVRLAEIFFHKYYTEQEEQQ